MPPKRNTRSMVDLPELFVRGLLHGSERPIFIGVVAFSRITLSIKNCLSSGERPGMTWACADTGTRTATASAADKRHRGRGRIPLCSPSSALPLTLANFGFAQVAAFRAASRKSLTFT